MTPILIRPLTSLPNPRLLFYYPARGKMLSETKKYRKTPGRKGGEDKTLLQKQQLYTLYMMLRGK